MRLATILLYVACAALLTAAAPQGRTRGPTRKPTSTPRPTPTPTPRPRPTPWPNERPSVKFVPSARELVLESRCDEGQPLPPACAATSPRVKLSARATDPDGDTLLYTYSTTGGRVEGEGPEVVLDVTDAAPGTYTVTVEVDDGNGGVATAAAEITVARCSCPLPPPKPPLCPTVTVSCPEGSHLIYKATVTGGDPNVTPTFKWTASPGVITGGQGTSSITVDVPGVTNMITATVGVGGYDRGCNTAATCTINFDGPFSVSRKVDEYGDIRFDEEKIRLDQFAAELRNDPSAEGHLLCYGGRRGRAGEAQRRCDRAKNHLVNTRDMDTARIVTVDAGRREGPAVELWLVPSGATPPAARPTVEPMSDR